MPCARKAASLVLVNHSAGFTMLVEEVAYEQWHRMLFARFLAENDLLMHPTGVPVTLEECEELAVLKRETRIGGRPLRGTRGACCQASFAADGP